LSLSSACARGALIDKVANMIATSATTNAKILAKDCVVIGFSPHGYRKILDFSRGLEPTGSLIFLLAWGRLG
jgi:hypothetical protein